MMADSWAHDGAVQEQIEDTVADAVKIARSRIASGEGTRFCEDCGMEIPAARRTAMPSSRTCVSCQDKRDASIRPAGSHRRGSKARHDRKSEAEGKMVSVKVNLGSRRH